jgi:hypothetical protein
MRGHFKNCRDCPSIPWMWVPVTTAWRVLRLRMEERPPIWRVAVNKLNKQPRTADDGWSSSLGVGRGANNSFPWKRFCYELLTMGLYYVYEILPLEIKQSGGKLLPHSVLRGGGGSVSRGIISKFSKAKFEGVVGTRWSWLRIGTGGRHLWVW